MVKDYSQFVEGAKSFLPVHSDWLRSWCQDSKGRPQKNFLVNHCLKEEGRAVRVIHTWNCGATSASLSHIDFIFIFNQSINLQSRYKSTFIFIYPQPRRWRRAWMRLLWTLILQFRSTGRPARLKRCPQKQRMTMTISSPVMSSLIMIHDRFSDKNGHYTAHRAVVRSVSSY